MNISNRKLITIECPKCGRQYLPSEIYLPNSFLGKPSEIAKTSAGKIDVFDGLSMNLKEEYICDGCGCNFEVVANVNFRSFEKNPKKTFSTVYTTPIEVKKIALFEGNAE